ncbi:MAG: glycosyltransferase, partial [Desulfomonile tiedjei]|nr:glycosyltransferase [Desulfomonile tiedjei]
VVSRLSSQKGVDILGAALPSLVQEDLQVVVLGTGDAKYEDSFRQFSEQYPGKVATFITYSNEWAHKIFAGADIVVVPSRYEPCGLNQLYALKYGTVPVVRITGGLTDTVEEFDLQRDIGTGFRFEKPETSALEQAILRAVRTYKDEPEAWKRLIARGMTRDFSWKRSAKEYLRLFEMSIKDRRGYLQRSVAR